MNTYTIENSHLFDLICFTSVAYRWLISAIGWGVFVIIFPFWFISTWVSFVFLELFILIQYIHVRRQLRNIPPKQIDEIIAKLRTYRSAIKNEQTNLPHNFFSLASSILFRHYIKVIHYYLKHLLIKQRLFSEFLESYKQSKREEGRPAQELLKELKAIA